MTRYVIRRILLIIPVVLLVAVAIFTIMHFSPGDPAEIILGAGATAGDIDSLRETMGLNDPFIVQLGKFMYDTFIKLDLGNSYSTNVPIAGELASRFSKTLVLALSAIVIELVVGIPLGIIAARNRGGIIDQLCMLLALIGISVPSFWIGIQLLLLFALSLGLLPTFGVSSWQGWILPIIVNSLRGVAQMARQSRSSMLEVIHSDYITTARAQGIPGRTLLTQYALPNALIPVIQTMGNSFGMSLGGTVVIENVFSIPGVGQYLVKAIVARDYAIVRSTVVVLAIAFCVVMLLVDVAFGFVDPRIKGQYEGQERRSRWLRRRKAHA